MPFAMQKSEKYFSIKILNAKVPVRLLKLAETNEKQIKKEKFLRISVKAMPINRLQIKS